jgi:hypothetical protein
MTIFIIYNTDRGDILGVEKAFTRRTAAFNYLDSPTAKQYFDTVISKRFGWIDKTYDDWLNSFIEEIELHED